ncbi:MAG: amidohydrolase, partial [Acidobacteria bacterium]|nr:amidohydrolase [Acidobacteriota bacterium]
DAVFGLHVETDIDVGQFAVRYGQRNASSDEVRIILHGRSCHAAYPSGGVDAIVMAAQVVTALQTLVSRNLDARDSGVLTLGTIHGGTQNNIVADRVELWGTVRTLDPEIRRFMLRRLREICEGVAQGMGGRAEIEIEPGYDALINDDAMVDLVRQNLVSLVGEENVRLRPKPNMGVEDFAYYLHHAPGAFYSLGVRNETRGIVHPVHQQFFDVDEECLAYGVAAQVLNTLGVLRRGDAE